MQNNSRAVFPNGMRALIVDSDARFLRSASLMLSLLNFRVATCETPVSAVKLLSGRLKDADVVFIDALRAATCGFDFRGIVEPHLCIPVVYFFSFNYKVAGEVAEALKRTISAATYIIKKPLDADDLCMLWRVIQLAKVLLRSGENIWLEWPRGSRVLPSTVEALLPGSSTVEGQGEDDEGREHVKVVRAGRGRRRKLGDSHDGGSSGRGRGRGVAGSLEIGVGGQPTRRQEQMNVTEGQESDDDDVVLVPSHQQPAQQNRRGVQAIGVQNQQHGRSLFMQPVPQILKVPRYNPMISADAAGPSSSNVAAFAGASNTTAAPALLPLPVYQAPARATSPAPHSVYSAQAPAPGLPPPVYQQQQPPVALYDFGNMVAPPAAVPTMAATSRHQPQFTFNQQHQQEEDMFAPWRQGSWMGRRETEPIMLSFQQPPAADPFTPMAGGGTAFGTSSPSGAADAGEYGNVTTVAHLQSPNVGAQPSDSFDDVLRAAMVEMDDTFPRSYYANCSAEALMAPATDELAAMQATLGNGNCSNYNAGIGSSMVTDVNGSNSASFMVPQDPAVPTGDQVELGAPDIYGSLVGSHQGPSAMFNGDGDMAAMFPSDQYDENTMFSLDALLDFDEGVPMHPAGQQVGAADSATATYATGMMPNGGESGGLGPNWNMGAADEGLSMLEEYLLDDNAADFLLLQDMNNGHQ